jgi:hypothetical protein
LHELVALGRAACLEDVNFPAEQVVNGVADIRLIVDDQ